MKNGSQAGDKKQEKWKQLRSWASNRGPAFIGRALIILSIISCGLFVSDSTPQAAARDKIGEEVSAATGVSELTNLDQLKSMFENDSGKVRIIALLSPT